MGQYMGTSEAAEKWGRSQATIQRWCREKAKIWGRTRKAVEDSRRYAKPIYQEWEW